MPPHSRGRIETVEDRLSQFRHPVAIAIAQQHDLVCRYARCARARHQPVRSEEHTSELQSLMRISYAVFCLKKKNQIIHTITDNIRHLSKQYCRVTQHIRTSH